MVPVFPACDDQADDLLAELTEHGLDLLIALRAMASASYGESYKLARRGIDVLADEVQPKLERLARVFGVLARRVS